MLQLQHFTFFDKILYRGGVMIKPFENINPKNREKLLRTLGAHTYTFKKNEKVLKSLIVDDYVGIVLSGTVNIIRYEYNGDITVVDEITADNIFGYNINSTDSNEYDIIATSEARILIIDYIRIKNTTMYNKIYYNQFIKNLYIIINEILNKRNERIKILTKKTIREKLLAYFNIERNKNHSKNIYLKSTFKELADYLAVDRSAMSRELKYMKDEGFIEIKKKRITILY